MTPSFDVVVAGAGPAGSATALRLATAGLRVALLDRATFPRDKACSEYMSPEGVRQLAALGVLGAVEDAGGRPIHGTTVVAPRGARLTGLFARAGHVPFRPTGLSVPRRILDEALLRAAAAAGAEVMERTTVTGLLGDGAAVAGVAARDAAGRRRDLRARVTVGADGLHSIVARRLGARRRGPLTRWAFVAHVSEVPGLADTAELHVARDGYAGLNPLGRGIANVAVVVPAARAAAARGRATGFFLEALDRFPGVRGRVRAERIVREVAVTGPFDSWARRVVAPGVLLVGDAADFFDPFTGEGIWAALHGAELAAATLGAALERPGPVAAAALRPYARARRRAFAGKWAVERLIGWAMLAPGFFDRTVARLEKRGLAHTLIGVTGDFVPASAVLNPLFLSRIVL